MSENVQKTGVFESDDQLKNDFPDAYIVRSESDSDVFSENRATVVSDDSTNLNSQLDLSDTTKKLLELDLNTQVASESEATQQNTEPPSDEIDLKLDDVDFSYLNLADDYGVPSLDIDESNPEFQQWVSKMPDYLGFDFAELKRQAQNLRESNKIRQQLEAVKQQQNLRRQEEYIKQKWGVDDTEYNRRMQILVDYFNNLDEVTKRLIDSDPNGPLKLWVDIQRSNDIKKPNVPRFEKSSTKFVSGASPSTSFTGSQIRAMSEAERRLAWDKILYASQNGLVDWSK